jgi:hypothetical protein
MILHNINFVKKIITPKHKKWNPKFISTHFGGVYFTHMSWKCRNWLHVKCSINFIDLSLCEFLLLKRFKLMVGKCVFSNMCIGRLAIRCGNMKGSGWPKNQLPFEMGRWDERCNMVEVQHNKDDYEHVNNKHDHKHK